MSDAPERIWIDAWGGNWSPVSGGTQGIEYIRADAALPAQYPVVKPLKWEGKNGYWCAKDGIGGVFEIAEVNGEFHMSRVSSGTASKLFPYRTLEYAIAAANLEHSRRILAAITMQPAPDVSALVGAASRQSQEVFADEGMLAREAIEYMEQVLLAALKGGDA